MADSGLSKVGVEFVVQNLGAFKQAIAASNGSLSGLQKTLIGLKNGLAAITPKATLLEKAFTSLGANIKNFANNIIGRILTIALGVLVRDAFRKVIDVLGEMGRAVFESGDAFQRLEIRLNRFNMNALKESGMDANKILEETIRLTKEQIGWAIDLAGLTVYNTEDIANAYSMARSFGFADQMSRDLTESILEFSSGMGLEAVVIKRIILNLGQMEQQGKITGRELRDLATGSLMPVNKIMNIIAEQLGITTDELNKMRAAGTTDPQWFIQAFGMLVGADFSGATADMAKTLTGALDNLKDIFVSRLGQLVADPIFDKLGEKLSSILSGFYNGKKSKPEFVRAFERIGASLVRIIDKLFALVPSANSIADSVIKALNGIATWLEQNEDGIVKFIKGAIKFIGDLVKGIKLVTDWLWKNREIIIAVAKAWLWWQVVATTLRWILILIGAIIGAIIKFLAISAGIKALNFILAMFGTSLGAILAPIAAVIAGIVLIGVAIDALANPERYERLGKMIVQGIAIGLLELANYLFKIMIWIATTLIGIWNSIWGIASPSKVMENSGSQMMKGLAKGIMGGTRGVVAVTEKAASAIFGSFSGSPTTGAGGGNAGQYLNNKGEVMRSNMDVVKGDPCAKDSTAGCLAEKLKEGIAGGMGGISDGLLNTFGNLGTEFSDLAGEIDTKVAEMKATVEATMQTLEQKIQTALDNAYAKTIESRDTFIGIVRTTGMNIDAWFIAQGLKFDEWRTATKEKILALPGILQAKLNEMRDYINTKVGEMGTAIGTFCTNAGKAISDAMGSIVDWILGAFTDTSTSATPPPTGTTSNASSSTSSTSSSSAYVTNNVTNNFNGSQAGQQITWDFEAGQFWV
jgi:tape measure domain-containing protein